MSERRSVAVTGLGVQHALGGNVTEFTASLRRGTSGVTFEPPGEDLPAALGVGAWLRREPTEILRSQLAETEPALRDRVRPLLRRASRSKQYALLAALEAWSQANLPPDLDPTRIGLTVAGSNQTHQLYQDMSRKFRSAPAFVRPSYAVDMWDSDLLGTASELFGALGEGVTTGGASAAGNVGLLSGLRMIRDGYADVCLVIAPMTELSPVELMAFFNLGALGAKHRHEPASECSRPFDSAHDGFVYGEGAAALVLESVRECDARGARPLAHVLGASSLLHGDRLTSPSREAEVRVMRGALADAGLEASDLDGVNAHATSTPIGDETEAEALREVLGSHASHTWVNATKSLTGHCLGAASALEAIACVQQLRLGFVHGNPNLADPVPAAKTLRLAPRETLDTPQRHLLSNGFGFGGINTSVVFGRA